MKRFLLIITIGFFLFSYVEADPVSVLTAKKAAQKHYKVMAEKAKLQVTEVPEFNLAVTYTNTSFTENEPIEKEIDLFYVFNATENNGFVIISADDRALPVIGYALNGTFTGDNLPPGLKGLLERRAQELIELINKKSAPLPELINSWNSLLE